MLNYVPEFILRLLKLFYKLLALAELAFLIFPKDHFSSMFMKKKNFNGIKSSVANKSIKVIAQSAKLNKNYIKNFTIST